MLVTFFKKMAYCIPMSVQSKLASFFLGSNLHHCGFRGSSYLGMPFNPSEVSYYMNDKMWLERNLMAGMDWQGN